MINGMGYPQSDFYSLWVYGWWMYLYFVTIKLIKSTIKWRNQADMLCHLNEQNTGKIIQIGMETWLLSKINIWGLPSPCQYLSSNREGNTANYRSEKIPTPRSLHILVGHVPIALGIWISGGLCSPDHMISSQKWFSSNRRKTNTKEIILTSHNSGKQHNEPVHIFSNYL